MSTRSPEWFLWGKAAPTAPLASVLPPDGPAEPWHPLICHMIDVAAVARCLLERALPTAVLRRIATAMQLAPRDAIAWTCFFVALHDIGKATPAFQIKWPPAAKSLQAVGLTIGKPHEIPHGELGVALASGLLAHRVGLESEVAFRCARAVAAHHGEFCSDSTPRPVAAGRGLWDAARAAIVDHLSVLHELDGRPRPAPGITQDNGFFVVLAGLTAVADWLGSVAEVFQYTPNPPALVDYAANTHQKATHLVDKELRWLRAPPAIARSFEELFGRTPWPLHDAVAQVGKQIAKPALIIIEAPMGEGKTEAALLLSEYFGAATGSDGFYIGLPTQATSNQMFVRVKRFLENSHVNQIANLHLAHGEAALSPQYQELRLQARAIYNQDRVNSARGEVIAQEWFARGKRTLLSKFAVGTIDQALLGALYTRHGFVRLFGLAGKTVILDEVHAYDAYTSRLIDTLVAWLAALGTSIVLLSATLPATRRKELARAYSGLATMPLVSTAYPRMTIVSEGQTRVETVTTRRAPQRVLLESIDPDPAIVAQRLVALLEGGGCAAWICNTVARAQKAFAALRELVQRGELPSDTDLALLHSRFPFEDRQRREQDALAKFGPDAEGKRPRRAILVGTQILEQSLDLDFDVMVSDLAPIDLLLQRCGRLHRHVRPVRPAQLQEPRLLVSQASPEFSSSNATIYDKLIVMRSWLALRPRSSWTLPDDIEILIEAVYGSGADALEATMPSLHDAFVAAKKRYESSTDKKQHAAHVAGLPDPRSEDPLGNTATALDDDENSDAHETLRALTRLGEPSVDAVCLYGTTMRPTLDREGRLPVDLSAKPDFNTARALLRRSVRVSHQQLYSHLINTPVPEGFSLSPYLQEHRAIMLGDGSAELSYGGVQISLDADLGVVIE